MAEPPYSDCMSTLSWVTVRLLYFAFGRTCVHRDKCLLFLNQYLTPGYGKVTVFIFQADPEKGDALLSYDQFFERLEDVDRRLAVYNIGHGDRIAVLAGSLISDSHLSDYSSQCQVGTRHKHY